MGLFGIMYSVPSGFSNPVNLTFNLRSWKIEFIEILLGYV